MQNQERYNRKQVLSSRSWSPYQQAIFDAVQHSEQNIMVEAVAGAGKTTSIEGIVASCPTSWKIKVLAFNVHIVEELKAKLPKSVTVTTVHKMGLTLLTRYFGGTIFQPNDRKYKQICKEAIDRLILPHFPLDDVQIGIACRYLEKVVHYAQVTLTPLEISCLGKMCDYFCISISDEQDVENHLDTDLLLPIVPKILTRGEKLAKESQDIGLDDLLWLPNQWNLSAPPCDLLLVDEAQDANTAMIGIYKKIVGDKGRIVIIGDPYQAIYGFSGSDSQSWQKLKLSFFPVELPLDLCYRCPKSHIALAQRLVPQIRAAENAIPGTIEVVTIEFLKDAVQPTDLILCRFTAPLVQLCLKLIAHGKKAKVRGKEIGEGLTALAKKASKGSSFDRFLPALKSYCHQQINHLHANGLEDAVTILQDKEAAIDACFAEFGHECKSISEFTDRMLDLFAEDIHGMIILSTIHRAKGDQAHVVYLIGCEALPFTSRAKHTWQIQQEYNLQYVALTRSRETLYLVPLPKDPKDLPRLLHHPYGGMDFQRISLSNKEKVIPVNWHNKELIREFYLEYTPQVGDKVRKKGLYGWDGDVLQVDQEKSLILWYGCGKIPDPPYPLWEDNNNLIDASWRKYE